MMRLIFAFVVLFVGACSVFAPHGVAQHEHPAGDPTKLGKVNFPVSCDASVQPQFASAMAMLHSFWYDKAKETFAAVAEKDSTCGMAYWGIAMTYYHPLWQAPGPDDLKAGMAARGRAKLVGAKTQRERDYIAAIEVFYKDSDTIDHRTRALAYERAMEQLQARYPAAYFPKGESPKNVSDETLPVVRSWVVTVVTSFRWLMVTVLSFEIATVKDPIFSPLLLM